MEQNLREDILRFFEGHATAYPLYEAFEKALFARFPQTFVRVQKTQITFSCRYVYLVISFLRVRKKAELPDPYLVLTLGLNYPLESSRVAAKTEPYPGRWTTHILIHQPDELDDQLFHWISEAYAYAMTK